MRIFLLFSCLISLSISAQDYRYTTSLFDNVEKTENVIYGNAPSLSFPYNNENWTTDEDLVMDIYEPEGDTHNLRPAIIFAHSGAFLNGNRNHEDMVAFCDSFAKKGYVTATIDYRKSFYIVSDVTLHGVRAVYRGIQDGRSAIRYLRANAASYGIDPEKIYLAGSSAGGFIALHAAYMNDPSERPIETQFTEYSDLIVPFFHEAPDMGAVDIGDNLNQNGQPDAIISLWGALQTTDLITADDTTPVYLAHGTGDTTVPFETDYPFSYPLFPEVDGSSPINDRLDDLGFTNKETYFVDGEPHEFYGTDNGDWPDEPNAYWDIILDQTTNFLWLQHKPTAQFSDFNDIELTIDFTDNSEGSLAWWWDFGDGTSSNEQNPSHVYDAEGDYNVTLYVENDIKSWDEISMTVTVEEILAIEETTFAELRLFPNPVSTTLEISGIESASLEIINTLGQVIGKKENATAIDVSALAPGIYLLKVSIENESTVKRFIKN